MTRTADLKCCPNWLQRKPPSISPSKTTSFTSTTPTSRRSPSPSLVRFFHFPFLFCLVPITFSYSLTLSLSLFSFLVPFSRSPFWSFPNFNDLFSDMDVEVLFSSSPFGLGQLDQFSYVRANSSMKVQLPTFSRRHSVELPKEQQTGNSMVRVSGGASHKSLPHFAHSLSVLVMESYGQLSVKHAETNAPISRAYVKVYAQNRGSSAAIFFKDGYTVLRGRFDYVSLNRFVFLFFSSFSCFSFTFTCTTFCFFVFFSFFLLLFFSFLFFSFPLFSLFLSFLANIYPNSNALQNVDKFSILVLSEHEGAVIKEAAPPKV